MKIRAICACRQRHGGCVELVRWVGEPLSNRSRITTKPRPDRSVPGLRLNHCRRPVLVSGLNSCLTTCRASVTCAISVLVPVDLRAIRCASACAFTASGVGLDLDLSPGSGNCRPGCRASRPPMQARYVSHSAVSTGCSGVPPTAAGVFQQSRHLPADPRRRYPEGPLRSAVCSWRYQHSAPYGYRRPGGLAWLVQARVIWCGLVFEIVFAEAWRAERTEPSMDRIMGRPRNP